MAGIEKITSEETTRTLVLPSGEVRRYSVTVWNATVANLTLMALGSSAPEILLSVIEICGNNFYAGELGPSTIVGSAAFNMLVISAVCVVAIPEGGGRLIKELPVFYITAAFSMLAYLWLIVILVLITPNRVDVWEGVVTFALFPVLVYVAYRADIQNDEPEGAEAAADSPEGSAAVAAIGYGKDGRPITRTDLSKIIALKSVSKLEGPAQMEAVASMLLPSQSKAYYRQSTGVAGVKQGKGHEDPIRMRKKLLAEEDADVNAKVAIVQWAQAARVCREADGKVELALKRTGNTRCVCSVQYKSESGTATEGVDFEAAIGTVTFARGQVYKSVIIKIVDDDEEEEDETFTVRLHSPSDCQLGETRQCEVTIMDDDGHGEIHFESREVECFESAGLVNLVVMRTHGCHGEVGCYWQTRDGSCKSPQGFASSQGHLIFGDGVTQMMIQVPIVDTGAYHRDDDFQVVLFSASGGARFVTDIMSRTKRAAVTANITVCCDLGRKAKVDEMVNLLDFSSVRAPDLASDSWSDQFKEALEVPEDGSSVNLIMYGLSLPWKLVGAAVPPPSHMGGWACFIVALIFIGLLTGLIGDLASHMGCCMGLPKSVTAITFVALGTSLPDTFASKSAAASEPYADASIVNITGSNSVNVFLGLGLPWMAAAIYWSFYGDAQEGMWRKKYKDEPWYNSDVQVGFAVPAGNLAYSVGVFCAVSFVCLCTLVLRRKCIGYELGGPIILQWLTFLLFVGLWFGYLYLSITNTMGGMSPAPGPFGMG